MKSVLKQRREQYQRQNPSPSSFSSKTDSRNERTETATNGFKGNDEMEKQPRKIDSNLPAPKPSFGNSTTPTTPEQPKTINMLERRKLIFQDSSSSESSDMDFSD